MYMYTSYSETTSLTPLLQIKFLSDVPPTNFDECEFSLHRLQQKMDALVNIDTANHNNNKILKNIALLDCCIKSYFSPNGQKCFRIFDTILRQ